MGLETALIGSAIIGAGSSMYGASQTRKATNQAIQAQKELAASLTYTPIDIDKLKAEATEQSIANAKASLQLEKQLTPDIASIRTTLPAQVSSELAMGGKLSPDIANQVASQARVIGGGAGTVASGFAPMTAALTGTTAQALKDSRQQKAASLLAANPLPTVGLDPGTLASLEAQNNAAMNQFNLEKAGISSNLINSQLQGNLAATGQTQSAIGSLGNLALLASMGGFGGSSGASASASVPASLSRTAPTYASTLPSSTWKW